MTKFYEYWGLKENPFLNNLDNKYIFLSTDFGESFARLAFNLTEVKGGLSLITGEIGCGKTTLSRALFQKLTEDNGVVALIANPRFSSTQLLRYIALEFGIEQPGRTKLQILDALNALLIANYKAGRTSVLIVDEAQLLSKANLEEVRLLTNLETDREKLLQIVLLGQPELGKRINRLPQLKQRITIRYHIGRLDLQEMQEYIEHRLAVAGANGRVIFSPEACTAVYKYSRGTPRLINTVCLNAILGGTMRQLKIIDIGLINTVTAELEGETA